MFHMDALTTPLTTIAALAAVAVLILAASKLARLAGLARVTPSGRRLALKETISLDVKRRLHLVEVDGRTVVLLTGSASDLVVGWLPEVAS